MLGRLCHLREVVCEMKITNYAIVFLCLISFILLKLSIQQQTLDKMVSIQQQYNASIDTALDAAVSDLVEVADGQDLQIEMKKCVDNFYNSLYAAFGILDSKSEQERIQMYFPCVAIVMNDGLYIQYNTVIDGLLVTKWTGKIPFVYEGSVQDGLETIPYTISFRLNDTVKLAIRKDNSSYVGTYSSLCEKYPVYNQENALLHRIYDDTILAKPGTFQNWKHQVITNTVTEYVDSYVRKYNLVAKDLGISYKFSLPETAADQIERSVSDITFLALFQGYPYGTGTADTYSNFAISGARIAKNKGYYACEDAEEGIYLYHREGCSHLKGTITKYESKEVAALDKAYPCPYCKP